MSHDVNDLMSLFDALFLESEGTRLVRGDREPIYLPRDAQSPHHRVVFAHGFFASALHEVSHWCIAGRERRTLVDYGYWYKPDGRSADEQRSFECVEIKPQALEWMFSVASGVRFHFSADNLGASAGIGGDYWLKFQENVREQVWRFLDVGLPARSKAFIAALSRRYETGQSWRRREAYAL